MSDAPHAELAGPATGGFDAHVTFYRVPDLDAASRFYHDLLGLPLTLDQGACRIYRVAAGAYLGLCRGEGAARAESVVITFVTDDVDAWHARLAAGGATIEKPPGHNADYGIYHCFVRDPAGHLVEIQRFDDPSWGQPETDR
ncbi:MAG: VOC family protein [Ectothiorhodospiraceae bacterium]|nr:VOC family protein [Ectothiorhodospiraceae bacterium]